MPLGTSSRPSAAPWLGFIAMCVGMFMAILDVQVVATSLPAIQASLGIAPEQATGNTEQDGAKVVEMDSFRRRKEA